jgi:hypothetical protein
LHHERISSASASPASPAGITWPRRSDVVPKLALIAVPTAAHATSANTSLTRSIAGRPRVRRRSSTAASTTSSVLPTVWPSTVPSGVEKSPTSRSPITMPGHRRGP